MSQRSCNNTATLRRDQRAGEQIRDEGESLRQPIPPQFRSVPRMPLNQPQPLQTRVPVLADDDVVVHGDAERARASCPYSRSNEINMTCGTVSSADHPINIKGSKGP